MVRICGIADDLDAVAIVKLADLIAGIIPVIAPECQPAACQTGYGCPGSVGIQTAESIDTACYLIQFLLVHLSDIVSHFFFLLICSKCPHLSGLFFI